MEEKLKKLRLLASTNSKRFLEALRDLIQEWKILNKTYKKKLKDDIKELEKIGNQLFMNIYQKKAEYNDTVIKAIVKGSANVFDKSGVKNNYLKIRQMLEYIQQNEPEKALKVLNSITTKAKHRGETIMRTLEIANNRANIIENAKKRNINHFRYEGPRGALSRDFCKSRVGKVYTLEEIETMDNGQGLPVLYFCGGYNCRHRWVGVIQGEIKFEKGAKPKTHEIETAKKLSKQGIDVYFVKESNIEGVKMYDTLINNTEKAELKLVKNVENQSNHITARLKESEEKGAKIIVIDITQSDYDIDYALIVARNYVYLKRYKNLEWIYFIKNGRIYKYNLRG
jgi:hypothetical protein